MCTKKQAKYEVQRLVYLIKLEMTRKTKQGELWTNGQCEAWDDYIKAIDNLKRLEEDEFNTTK